MQTTAMLVLAAAEFTNYPAFGDRIQSVPARPAQMAPGPSIEALVDRGPIVEMIIRCGGHSAIISYSKVEKVYCSPKLVCMPSLNKALGAACGKSRG